MTSQAPVLPPVGQHGHFSLSFPCPCWSHVLGTAWDLLLVCKCLQVHFGKPLGVLAGPRLTQSLTVLFQLSGGPDGSRVSRNISLAFASAPDIGWLWVCLGSQTHPNYQTPGSCSIPAGLDHSLLHPEPKGSASRGARDGKCEEPYSKERSCPRSECPLTEMSDEVGE